MLNSKSEPLNTVVFIVSGFIVFFLITNQKIFLYLALTIGILGLLSKWALRSIDYLWIKIGFVLGLIFPKIILFLVFFFVLTPIAWLSKLFDKSNALDLKNKNKSMFIARNETFDHKSFENPW